MQASLAPAGLWARRCCQSRSADAPTWVKCPFQRLGARLLSGRRDARCASRAEGRNHDRGRL